MSWQDEQPTTVEALRRAWASADRELSGLSPEDVEPGAVPDADRIWRAVAGELPAAEVQELAEAAARNPDVAQAWRLARELQASMPATGVTATPRAALRFPSAARAPWSLALAATLALAVGAGMWARWGDGLFPGQQPTRGGESGQLALAIPDGAEVLRDQLVLRWEPAPGDDTRYAVRLTTADLRVLADVRDLATPTYRVPPEALSGVPPGSTLLWQVDARLADNRVLSSSTARLVLRD